MIELRTCGTCGRHVAIAETACPFCAAPLVPRSPAAEPLPRMSRAAIFAGAATLASAAAFGACWTGGAEPRKVVTPAPRQDAGPTPDARAPRVVGPDEDDFDRNQDYQDHPCFDTPQGPVCAPYGAPPARRRLV